MDPLPTPTDGELLQAFRTRDDQAAFAELVRRHGRGVLGAAQSVGSGASAAQDVLQATFLTLARKAATLEPQASVIGWLHHVALCLARDERKKELRRKAREQEAAMSAQEAEPALVVPAAARRALHEELDRLAEKDRQPIMLHHFEGLSYAAAAALCGCSDKAFSVRLVRARERLRQRLVARGVTLGADGLGGVLEEGATSVALPAALVAATCQAASLLAAGKTLTGSGLVSAKVASLTKSALNTLFWAKVKTAATAVVLTAGVAVGGGVVVHQALTHRAAPPPAPAAIAAPAGSVWTWGSNQFGQFGDGTTNNRPTAVPVPGFVGVKAVAAGFGHTVAIRDDSSVWAWGENQYGELGDGTTTERHTPVPVKTADGSPLGGITAVAAGRSHTVALKADGSVLTWGRNRYVPFDHRISAVPEGLPGLSSITAIAAGDNHGVALRSDGTAWAWGYNADGQLGDGTKGETTLTPVQVKLADGSPLSGIIAIAAGSGCSIALRNDHTVWFWGRLAAGRVDVPAVRSPVQVRLADGAELSGVTAIAAGSGHAVALRSDSTVWAWGGNAFGQLGDGTRTHSQTPVLAKMSDGRPLSGITAIAGGQLRTCALQGDRTVWAWGSLASGARQGEPVPVKLADGIPPSGITAIAAGSAHTVVLVGPTGAEAVNSEQ